MKDRHENKFAWSGAILVVLFFAILNGFLASRFSLWGDEFDAITPAFRPWKGEHNFWWQIRQYIANPPGENLILRLYYKSGLLTWLREISPELFWRVPYILVFACTSLTTFYFSKKWSRSPLVATLAFALFVSSPGPFTWATEVRFYGWAIFFMTCAVWQGIAFIEKSDFVTGLYSKTDFIWLSVVTAFGVCFHVSMALICYLLLWFTIGVFCVAAWQWKKERKKPSNSEIFNLVSVLLIGLVPYFVFKHAKHHWMFVPGGRGYGAVFRESFTHWLSVTPGQIQTLLPFSTFGKMFILVVVLSIFSSIVFAFLRKNRARLFVSIYLGTLVVGGTLVITFSSYANQFSILSRHYLFVIPTLIAAFIYIVGGRIEYFFNKAPRFIRVSLMCLFFGFGLWKGVELAKDNLNGGSAAKVNYDLASFRDFYRQMPDRRNLLLVGVGDGELWATTDDGGYIGGAHISYTKEFSPHYLNARAKAPSVPLTFRNELSKYDLLIFSGGNEVLVRLGLETTKLSCHVFRGKFLQFCRI